MTDNIVLNGVIATAPRCITTSEGLAITSFRLASVQRRYDKATSAWTDSGTNWYTVSAFRQLAAHCAESLGKGDRVIVSGRLRIREWESAGRAGTSVEIEAESIGHDLAWGCGTYRRRSSRPLDEPAGQQPASSGSGDERATPAETDAAEPDGGRAPTEWAAAPLATPF